MATKNIRSLSARKAFEPNLFEKITELTEANAEVQDFQKLAEDFLLNDSTIYGTRSFYDFLKPENQSKKIHICTGSACLTTNTQIALEQKLTDYFLNNEIGHAACLGHCHSNAAFLYKNQTYSLKNSEELEDIVLEKLPSNNEYQVQADAHPILTNSIENLDELYHSITYLKSDKQEVINQIMVSQLRGRGGAGFSFWVKLKSVFDEKSDQKYIVCNADEGDPGAYSDMYLLENQPNKVLIGMYLSGIVTGANTGILYIRKEYPQSVKTIHNTIEYLEKKQLTPGFNWKVIIGQGAYVCGEETALLNSIEGLRPEVRVRPPYPAQYGLYGKPTVLSNVETFANLYWIFQNGGQKYAQLGTEKSKGTKLVSLDSHFNRPGIYEITMGTSLEIVVNQYGKGFKHPVKAIQVGGPLGGIVPIEKIQDLTLDFESFSQNGFLLGHAGIVSIPAEFPMIDYLKHLLKFATDESCGKCFPCRIGTYRGFELLQKAQNEDYIINTKLWNDLLETLEKGSLCALGGGVPLPIRNALQYFSDELKPYFS